MYDHAKENKPSNQENALDRQIPEEVIGQLESILTEHEGFIFGGTAIIHNDRYLFNWIINVRKDGINVDNIFGLHKIERDIDDLALQQLQSDLHWKLPPHYYVRVVDKYESASTDEPFCSLDSQDSSPKNVQIKFKVVPTAEALEIIRLNEND